MLPHNKKFKLEQVNKELSSSHEMKHLIILSFSVNCSCPWPHALVRLNSVFDKPEEEAVLLTDQPPPTSYHARVNCSLLDISSDTSHKGVAVLKVGVEVGLWGDGNNPDYRTNHCFTESCLLPLSKLSDWFCCKRNFQLHLAAIIRGVCTALTWYMTEEGRGSMHGCWSGKGSSSSRSTLESASSNVTADVMVLPRKTSVRVK